MKLRTLTVAGAFALAAPLSVVADRDEPADIGKLFTGNDRVQQADLDSMSRDEIRLAGMRMFTFPFKKEDGFGDGDDEFPSGKQGERGSLQGNGTFQRIGGLDAQNCLECHGIVSMRTTPMRFGIGGVGGVNSTVMGAGGNTFVDLDLQGRSGGVKQSNIDGRVINPPFIFGAGGVELLANEMTEDLQAIVAQAKAADGTYDLVTKGISFGSITSSGGVIDASNAEGTFDLEPTSEDFLVVAPFGRKGSEKSTRTFDVGAMSFHFGMRVDNGLDHDNDGVVNEVTTGEMSALSVFVGTAQTPFAKRPNREARRGRQLMDDMGCTECHVPSMETKSKNLGFRFPEIAQEPSANVHTTVDLTKKPMSFKKNNNGGITVNLFADLKRHYMGPSMEEFNGDGMFTTMRLWGVADTAPYLHDGRALTLNEAIVMHGADEESDANEAVSNYNAGSQADKDAVLAFLDTLRSPNGTFKKLDRLAKKLTRKGHRDN